MQIFSERILKSTGFSAICLSGLIVVGCSGSDNPAADAVNLAPVAVDDSFSVVKGSTTTLDLTGNDSDADDGLNLASITIVTPPTSGSVSVNPDGSVAYTHDCGDATADEFIYAIEDNSAVVSNTATVILTVTPTPPSVEIGIYDSTVVEGADDFEFVISLSSVSDETISVDYVTADGTALAATDYSAAGGTVQFSCGEVRKFVTVPVLIDSSPPDPNVTSKNMQLVLSNPNNAALNFDNTATGTIIDRDAMSSDSPFKQDWGVAGVFSDATVCANCHQSNGTIMQYDNPDAALSTNDISPSTQWQHTVMAQSFNDPYWQAAVQDEVESFPALAGLVEDTCTKCHTPMGHTHAHHTNTGLDSEGYYRFDTARTENPAREGVSCTLCHQMQDTEADSGNFDISDDTLDKKSYGPYLNPRQNPMSIETGYTPAYGMHLEKSEFCANCHTLYTPAIDPDTGQPSGPNTGLASATKGFLEQGPYLEWQNSVYTTGQAQEAQCQDCHMPVPTDTYRTRISTKPIAAQLDEREPYPQHILVGGNAHLLEILRNYRVELGIEGSTSLAGFNDQIALTQNFLGGAAAISISTPTIVDNDLSFDVGITNNAGHKIPSAYPSRRMWLHVTVRDNTGDVIFVSGAPDARGYISTDAARLKADCMAIDKLDGFESGLCYEPHRDVINDPSQVAIYETVLGDVKGEITHTLLHGAQYLKDNRIPPVGFTSSVAATIEPQTVPAGVAGDGDFNCVTTAEGCGADSVHYQVDIEGQTGPYSVEARLLYQATQPGFVDGMHTDGDRVNRFKVMYDAVPPSVEVLATAVK